MTDLKVKVLAWCPMSAQIAMVSTPIGYFLKLEAASDWLEEASLCLASLYYAPLCIRQPIGAVITSTRHPNAHPKAQVKKTERAQVVTLRV